MPILSDTLPVFVLSLDRTPERYTAVKASLDRAGIMHQRVSAVDGYLLGFTDEHGASFTGLDLKNGTYHLEANKFYTIHCPGKDVRYECRTKWRSCLTAGEFGCLCSHVHIWQKMVAGPYSHALVLEDDVMPAADIHDTFPVLLQHLPYDYEFLYLVYAYEKGKFLDIINNPYVKKAKRKGTSWLTGAYMISQTAAVQLLKAADYVYEPIDHDMSRAIIDGAIRGFAVSEQTYFTVQEGPSTIGPMGRPG